MIMIFMITLLTGTPGAGKTMWIVTELVKLYKATGSFINFFKKKEPVTRDLFVHGIPELNFGTAYHPVYCRSTLCDVCQSQALIVIPEKLYNQFGECVNAAEVEAAESSAKTVRYIEDWPMWATDGCLIVLDEVQRVWRPRPAGATVPPEISALETHRHRGIDFWLISQSAKLLDLNIRRLVGRHIHLQANWKGRVQFEWPECHEGNGTAGAISRPYVLRKSIFSKYKSASVHTTQQKRPPLALYLVIVGGFVLAWLVYDLVSRFTPHEPPAAKNPAVEVHQPQPSNLNTTVQAAVVPAVHTPAAGVFDFTPRVKGRAETAPAYDGMLHIQSVPFPEQCFSWATDKGKYCKCLTDQGTPYEMPYNVCVAYARREVYNPYRRSETAPAQARSSPNSPPSSPPLQVAGSLSQAAK